MHPFYPIKITKTRVLQSVSLQHPSGQIKLLACVFALLICNAARSLASRLARGLALAATAVLYGFCNIFGFDGLNSFHDKPPRVIFLRYDYITQRQECQQFAQKM